MNFIYLSMHLISGDPLVFNLLSCRFAASSDIKILCFVNLSASFPFFTSGGPSLFFLVTRSLFD